MVKARKTARDTLYQQMKKGRVRIYGDKAGKAKWNRIIKYWQASKKQARKRGDKWSFEQATNALKKARAMRKKYV